MSTEDENNSVSKATSTPQESCVSRKPSQTSLSSSNGPDPFDEFQTFFGKYWAEIKVFNFEKAKEMAEKEKEKALKFSSGSSSGFTWIIITASLAQIATCEKLYLSLGFLAPKGFLSKNPNIRPTLESVKMDLKKLSESSFNSLPGRFSVSDIVNTLLIYINYRIEMIEFYEKLANYNNNSNKFCKVTDFLTVIEAAGEKLTSEKEAVGDVISILGGILAYLQYESRVMENILKAIVALESWEYLDASIAIQLANKGVLDWCDFIQTNAAISKKPSFYASNPNFPNLYLWMKKFKGILLSKFTLYFHEVLSMNSNSSLDFKTYCSRLPVDYSVRITSFMKKTDASSFCIMLDARDVKYHQQGYKFPLSPCEPSQGLDMYPAIFSHPAKPNSHWPALIMTINDKAAILNAEKCVGLYDSSIQTTYFIQKTDPKMYAVLIYESKRSEKDTQVLKFMNELLQDLKCYKTFQSLKSFKP